VFLALGFLGLAEHLIIDSGGRNQGQPFVARSSCNVNCPKRREPDAAVSSGQEPSDLGCDKDQDSAMRCQGRGW
jgi:hypothetical protein